VKDQISLRRWLTYKFFFSYTSHVVQEEIRESEEPDHTEKMTYINGFFLTSHMFVQEEIRESEGPDLTEKMKDEIRQWFWNDK
jgi:hypothetical protein